MTRSCFWRVCASRFLSSLTSTMVQCRPMCESVFLPALNISEPSIISTFLVNSQMLLENQCALRMMSATAMGLRRGCGRWGVLNKSPPGKEEQDHPTTTPPLGNFEQAAHLQAASVRARSVSLSKTAVLMPSRSAVLLSRWKMSMRGEDFSLVTHRGAGAKEAREACASPRQEATQLERIKVSWSLNTQRLPAGRTRLEGVAGTSDVKSFWSRSNITAGPPFPSERPSLPPINERRQAKNESNIEVGLKHVLFWILIVERFWQLSGFQRRFAY